jgi:hypothetical protein
MTPRGENATARSFQFYLAASLGGSGEERGERREERGERDQGRVRL